MMDIFLLYTPSTVLQEYGAIIRVDGRVAECISHGEHILILNHLIRAGVVAIIQLSGDLLY